MAELKWKNNWERSYRIRIGNREYKKSLYDPQVLQGIPESLARPVTESDEVTVPENAVLLSNLTEDGNSRRGFTFRFNGTSSLSQKGSDSEKALLELYNPSQELVDIINTDRGLVIIEAGYEQQVEMAYTGDIVSVTPHKSGADLIYRVQCASGAMAMRNTLVSLHYDESISEKDIIIDMVGRFPGTALGTYGLSGLSNKYKTGGRGFTGDLVTNFDNIMARNNLNYAHTNGIIVITPYRLLGEDYDAFARTNYNIPVDTIKKITDVSKREDISSKDTKAKVRKIQINTNFIPVQLSQFITIPDSDHTKDFTGTYQVEAKRLILESKGSGWDVVLNLTEV